jgi:hypothetical protein
MRLTGRHYACQNQRWQEHILAHADQIQPGKRSYMSHSKRGAPPAPVRASALKWKKKEKAAK